MKILWYSSINELDYEMQQLFDRLPGYEFHMAIPESANAYFFPVDVKIDYPSIADYASLRRVLAELRPDILVHRYRRDHVPILEAANDEGVPVLVWVTEQGPERSSEWQRNMNFRHLAANNVYDVEYFKARGAENVYYWPFGCLPFFHRRVPPVAKFKADFVAYGNPLPNLYASKRESLETLVVPVIAAGHDVALWGARDHWGGWLAVPGVVEARHYKGLFNYAELPAVNSSAKIVLGMNSNGRYGAFGSRLSRALACASFTIWYYSEGMEDMPEGYRNRVNCCWSRHADETMELVRYYLGNDEAREKLALAGQQFAYERLDYEKIVPPILHRVIEHEDRRSHSYYYEVDRRFRTATERTDRAEILRSGRDIFSTDVSAFTTSAAIEMATSFVHEGQPRLANIFLKRFKRLCEATVRRHLVSGEKVTVAVDPAPLEAARRRLDDDLARGLAPAPAPTGRSTPERRVYPSWELFLRAALHVPLDRERVVLAGDVVPAWADFLCDNVAATTIVTSKALPPERPRGADKRPRPRQAQPGEEVTGFDQILYFALEPDAAHARRLRDLYAALPQGGGLVVLWRPAAVALEVPGNATWRVGYDAVRDFGFDGDDAAAGEIRMQGAWKDIGVRGRLLAIASALSRRIEPRTCHLSLDPIEILRLSQAWAEGYVRVMQRICRAEGLEAATVSLRADMPLARQREHAVLEVDGATWDPMLGIGYEATVDALLATPSRADAIVGEGGGPHWAAYELAQMTGARYWERARKEPGPPDVAEPAAWSDVEIPGVEALHPRESRVS